jgi:CBS domain-containing protein
MAAGSSSVAFPVFPGASAGQGWKWRCARGYARAAMSAVGEMMARDVLAVAPEDTIGEAAQKMVERGVGSAVVLDYGRLIGIFTERDLLRAVADRVHSSEARVREWMTAEPITITPETSAEEAAQTMLDNGFRHLPVVEGERAVGIISIRDVARWIAEDTDG